MFLIHQTLKYCYTQGGLAAPFDLAAFPLYMIAQVKKSVNQYVLTWKGPVAVLFLGPLREFAVEFSSMVSHNDQSSVKQQLNRSHRCLNVESPKYFWTNTNARHVRHVYFKQNPVRSHARPNFLNKKFRYKRDGTSYISHLSGVKCKFVLLQSWHVVESSVLQTKHASKSHETKMYH